MEIIFLFNTNFRCKVDNGTDLTKLFNVYSFIAQLLSNLSIYKV